MQATTSTVKSKANLTILREVNKSNLCVSFESLSELLLNPDPKLNAKMNHVFLGLPLLPYRKGKTIEKHGESIGQSNIFTKNFN